MKPEYLKREVTINSKSFMNLTAEFVAEEFGDLDNMIEALALAENAAVLFADLDTNLGLDGKAKTFAGAEYATAAMLTLGESHRRGEAVLQDHGDKFKRAHQVALGMDVSLICDIADKLFARDEDHARPEEKDGGEA